MHNKSQKNIKYLFPLHFCACHLCTSNILYSFRWLFVQFIICKRRNTMTQSGIFGHHIIASFLPPWQPVIIMFKWCVILTVTLPWNLVTCLGKMHVNTCFFFKLGRHICYMLYTYLDQIIIMEGNGKIKETTLWCQFYT